MTSKLMWFDFYHDVESRHHWGLHSLCIANRIELELVMPKNMAVQGILSREFTYDKNYRATFSRTIILARGGQHECYEVG